MSEKCISEIEVFIQINSFNVLIDTSGDKSETPVLLIFNFSSLGKLYKGSKSVIPQ